MPPPSPWEVRRQTNPVPPALPQPQIGVDVVPCRGEQEHLHLMSRRVARPLSILFFIFCDVGAPRTSDRQWRGEHCRGLCTVQKSLKSVKALDLVLLRSARCRSTLAIATGFDQRCTDGRRCRRVVDLDSGCGSCRTRTEDSTAHSLSRLAIPRSFFFALGRRMLTVSVRHDKNRDRAACSRFMHRERELGELTPFQSC